MYRAQVKPHLHKSVDVATFSELDSFVLDWGFFFPVCVRSLWIGRALHVISCSRGLLSFIADWACCNTTNAVVVSVVGWVAPPERGADVFITYVYGQGSSADIIYICRIIQATASPRGVVGGWGLQLRPGLCLSVYLALPPAQGCCVPVSPWWWMSSSATSDRCAWPRILCSFVWRSHRVFPLRSILSCSCFNAQTKRLNERISHLGWLNVRSNPVETLVPAILNTAEAFGRRLGQGPFWSLPTERTHLHVWQRFKELNEASEIPLSSQKIQIYISLILINNVAA